MEREREREFRKQTRVTYNTSRFLCKSSGPYLKKDETRFRVIVLVQEMVAMSLRKLGSGNGLQRIGDLYGVHKNTLSKIIRECYRVVKKHLQPVLIQTSDEL